MRPFNIGLQRTLRGLVQIAFGLVEERSGTVDEIAQTMVLRYFTAEVCLVLANVAP